MSFSRAATQGGAVQIEPVSLLLGQGSERGLEKDDRGREGPVHPGAINIWEARHKHQRN